MRNYPNFYINGEWVSPAIPKSLDVINPATEEVCGQISLGSEIDVDRAVAAARTAFATFAPQLARIASRCWNASWPSTISVTMSLLLL